MADARSLSERLVCAYQPCVVCGLLFRDSYQRCFPHCCPQHTSRRSCGTQLMVQVGGDLSVEEALTLQAFARFELSTASDLEIGAVADVERDIRQLGNLRGAWIRCHRDAKTTAPITFVVNCNALEDEWHYGWKGSASKADRSAAHVLTVYVFQADAASNLIVVGRAQSSAFTLSSARRAIDVATERPRRKKTYEAGTSLEATHILSSCGIDALSFTDCGCPGQLFRSMYSRCFPHCCQGHVAQSICGGPVVVRLTFAASAAPVHQYAVYARFEEFALNEFDVAMEMPLRYLQANTNRHTCDLVEWFHGEPEPSSLPFPDSVQFHVNASKRGKHYWPYGWKGSASLTKRATRHVLRVYVFQLRQAETRDSVDVLARIVATLTSPSFQIESQRSSTFDGWSMPKVPQHVKLAAAEETDDGSLDA
ncbi:hypothetical protein ACHHYP_11126 [Achlya hypogyna]|uniref:Uncharacterized protein n=1 Tax=Achlya hypogyna TaxID=1202772 RepID=A0A1V9YJX0_ACHHY|nr:hypothetical protein ACHHYP_11126 [Achlya hypogyna]